MEFHVIMEVVVDVRAHEHEQVLCFEERAKAAHHHVASEFGEKSAMVPHGSICCICSTTLVGINQRISAALVKCLSKMFQSTMKMSGPSSMSCLMPLKGLLHFFMEVSI